MTKQEALDVLGMFEGILPEPMPDEIWEMMKAVINANDKEGMTEVLRGTIITTMIKCRKIVEKIDSLEEEEKEWMN